MKNHLCIILTSITFASCGNSSKLIDSKQEIIRLNKTYCDGGANIEIVRNNDTLYQHCFIDVSTFGESESFNVNNDDKIDFLCTLRMEDYFILMIFISEHSGYKAYQLKETMDAQIYSSVSVKN